MKKIISIFWLAAFFSSFSSAAQETVSPEADKFFNNAMSKINPRHVSWVKTTAKTLSDKNLIDSDAKSLAVNYARANSIKNNMDIEALCFLVLMQAAKNSQEDLKSIMAGVKAINENKKTMREAIDALNNNKQTKTRSQVDSFRKLYVLLPGALAHFNQKLVKSKKSMAIDSAAFKITDKRSKDVTREELNIVKEKLQADMDSMNELSESQSIRLQMYMDRRNKIIETLSNILKSISDTQNSIVQNLK